MDADIAHSVLPVACASIELGVNPPRDYPRRFKARALACTGMFLALAAPALARTGSSPSAKSSGAVAWSLMHAMSDLQILERFEHRTRSAFPPT